MLIRYSTLTSQLVPTMTGSVVKLFGYSNLLCVLAISVANNKVDLGQNRAGGANFSFQS